jgi:hypothetical protein
MAKEIFDQERPRSVKARRLDEAFAGCEEWTTAPPSPPRTDTLDIAPWLSKHPSRTRRAAGAAPQSRAA